MNQRGRWVAGAVAMLGILAVCWFIFRTWTTATGFPLLAVDSQVFLPPALSWAGKGTLVNEVWPSAAILDPTGNRRMIYHGFLYPLILGSLPGTPSPQALGTLLALIQLFAAILFTLILVRLSHRDGRRPDAITWFWIVSFSVAGAYYTYGSPGRPEPLVAVVLYAALLIGRRFPVDWRIRGVGVLLGIIAALHPFAGGFSAIIAIGGLAWVFPPVRAMKAAIITGGYAMIAFGLLVTFVYPYSFDDWIFGTIRMGKVALRPSGLESLRPVYWWTNGPNWFFPATLGLIAAGGLVLLRRHRPASSLLFACAVAAALWTSYQFVFVPYWATYNLVVFLPLGLLGVFFLLTGERLPPRCLSVMTLLTSCGIAVGAMRDMVQRISYAEEGISLAQARTHFRDFRKRHPGSTVSLAPALFTLADLSDDLGGGGKSDFLMEAQAFGLRREPPAVPGYRLIENYFQQSPPEVLGISYAKDHRGCGFAIYQKIATEADR